MGNQVLISSIDEFVETEKETFSKSNEAKPQGQLMKPELLWKFQTEGALSWIQSHPSIKRGNVYISNRSGFVYCLSTNDGSIVWKLNTRSRIACDVVLHNGLALFGSEEGQFYCVDALTGKPLWVHKCNGPIYSTPIVWHDQILYGSDDHNLYSVELSTGKTLFQFETGGDVCRGFAIQGDMLVFGSYDRYVYCFDLVTRKVVWKYLTEFWVQSSPVIRPADAFLGDSIYIGSWMDIICLELNAGEKRWGFPTLDEVCYKPLVHDYHVILPYGHGAICSVNYLSGMPNWISQIPEPLLRNGTGIGRTPELLNDSTAVLPVDGGLFAFEMDHGDLLWEIEEADCVHQPLCSGNRLYVPSDRGSLYCYSLESFER